MMISNGPFNLSFFTVITFNKYSLDRIYRVICRHSSNELHMQIDCLYIVFSWIEIEKSPMGSVKSMSQSS